ncbi:MAG: DUF349 domain-containing protein [Atopobiaceae bacterium]|nr:DUF349 domain-containing protein [Atopobiaceae bacterium]
MDVEEQGRLEDSKSQSGSPEPGSALLETIRRWDEERAREAAQAAAVEAESVEEPESEPADESQPVVAAESVEEPAAELVDETEPAVEPVSAEQEPESSVELEVVSESEPEAEVETGQLGEAQDVSEAEPVLESVPEEPEVAVEAVSEPEAEPEPEAETEPELDSMPEPEPTPEPEPAKSSPLSAPLSDDPVEDRAMRDALTMRLNICHKAELAARYANSKRDDMPRLRKEFEAIKSYGLEREEELKERFEQACTAYEQRRDEQGQARVLKEAITRRAEELRNSEEWRTTNDEFRKLMDDWKKAGSAGRDVDRELWAQFNDYRQHYYDRRDKFFEDLRDRQKQAGVIKREIIEEARGILDTEGSWKAAGDRLNELMDRWKEAGGTTRSEEHTLWEEFNGIRKEFRSRRRRHFAELDQQHKENAEAKSRIVDEAQAIADSAEYSLEHVNRMKELNDEWKSVGYAGKETGDELWARFRAAQDSFWEGNRAYRGERQAERSERMQAAVERKQKRVRDLTDQVERLKERLEEMIGEEREEEIKGWIAEKEELIAELTKDIEQISAKLS